MRKAELRLNEGRNFPEEGERAQLPTTSPLRDDGDDYAWQGRPGRRFGLLLMAVSSLAMIGLLLMAWLALRHLL
jgi:hypothetical protein